MQFVSDILAKWGALRIERITALIGSVSEGAALLEFAAKDGTSLAFSPGLLTRWSAGKLRNPTRWKGENSTILLNPFMSDKRLVSTMAHELRHLWQMRRLENPGLMGELSFERSVAFTRFVEGDAFVFQNYLLQKITKATGVKLPLKADPDANASVKAKMPDLESGEGLLQLFRNFQSSGYATQYDDRVLDRFNEAAADAGGGKDGVRAPFNLGSAARLGALDTIPLIGTGEKALRYLDANGSDTMLDAIWDYVRDPKIIAARKAFSPP